MRLHLDLGDFARRENHRFARELYAQPIAWHAAHQQPASQRVERDGERLLRDLRERNFHVSGGRIGGAGKIHAQGLAVGGAVTSRSTPS